MGGPVQQSTFAGAVGATASVLIIWALNTYAHAAIPDVIGSTFSTLITLLLVHFVPDTQPATPAPK